MIKKQGLGVGGKERSAGEKRLEVAKGIKMKIIHLSRSVWQTGGSIRQCHAYNYACTVWGSLGDASGGGEKNICCYVSPIGGIKKGEKSEDVSR